MAQSMMVYKGKATDMGDMTPEQGAAVTAAWGVWIEQVGPALVDVGTPFGADSSIIDDGSDGIAAALMGYSIVEADDLSAATRFANDNPFLSDGKGDFAVDIHEIMPVPFDD